LTFSLFVKITVFAIRFLPYHRTPKSFGDFSWYHLKIIEIILILRRFRLTPS